MRDDFAVFLLSHGRADNVETVKALDRGGYTGRLYFIIDNEDDQKSQYEKNFGKNKIIVFDKQSAYDKTDTMDNFGDHRAIVYARNEAWRIAKVLNLTYFLMLEDDYTGFYYRYAEGEKLRGKPVKYLDSVFDSMLRFLDATGAATVAFCQGGDFLGGINGKNYWKGMLRKTMNSFFCRTSKPLHFRGTMNEDVVTYTTLGSRGELFLSPTAISVIQLSSQSVKGGMTDAYKEGGTYLKSFYAVMSMPSSVNVGMLNSEHKRIHHHISWENTVPKILSEKWRKEGTA